MLLSCYLVVTWKFPHLLQDEIERSKKHLLYLIGVHIFSEDDIKLNTKTLGWPAKIRPVFEQNTEIVEDCKAKFEDNLQKKSEWITRELEKLSSRVQELEELGEINSIQQYTYVITITIFIYFLNSFFIIYQTLPICRIIFDYKNALELNVNNVNLM